ncbi:MAG TPA: phosphatase PAP2 family protein [Clostridiales bacterium]|nr:phosphatase PAP2 family protein [Clostridiales bacterium]
MHNKERLIFVNTKSNNIRALITKYKHGWVFSYFIIYMIWFTYLEKTITTKFTPVYSKLDDLIPFAEMFIIPYLLWFIYILVTVVYFFLTSKTDFYKYCAYLFVGMTVCLAIFTIWPNGHYLRENLNNLGRSNIFIDMLAKIYHIDTATNVFPSIHVFNSIGALIAIYKSETLNKIRWVRWSGLILTVSICMSTVFLKQHSIIDVFGGVALGLIMYVVVYVPSWGKAPKKVEQGLSNI